jgi:hypothetical protein
MACAIAVGTCLAVLGGCRSVTRVENGRYASPKGYTVVAPGTAWTVVPQDEADVEWRRTSPAGRMLVNGSCEDGTRRRPLGILARQLMMGVMDRTVIARDEVTIGGRPARHVVLDARPSEGAEPVRIEAYVMKDARCVYDFLYAAPVASFETSRPEFRRVVDSLTPRQD